MDKKTKVVLPRKVADGWDEMRAAAGLLRLGKGVIVSAVINKRKVKYVKLTG